MPGVRLIRHAKSYYGLQLYSDDGDSFQVTATTRQWLEAMQKGLDFLRRA